MTDYQSLLLDWIAARSGYTGAIIFAAGLLYVFYGLRTLRLLLVLSAGGLGCLTGVLATKLVLTNQPELVVIAVAGLATTGLALFRPRWAVVMCNCVTWAAIGGHLASQVGLNARGIWVALGVCGGTGLILALLSRDLMTALLTAAHGAALLLVGFVGLTSTMLPSVATTFRSWAHNQPWFTPVLLAMLTMMAYSIQAMHRQGDIQSGVHTAVRL